MILAIGAIVVGVVTLAAAADQFVIGAARVALLRRVPALVVGVVIVGFGTSAPELLVSAIAAGRGESEVAVGNIVGSNVANLSLLLGIGALIVPLTVSSTVVRREAPLVLVAVVLFGLAVQGGGVDRWEGVGLAVVMVVTLGLITRRSPSDPIGADVVDLTAPSDHHLGPEVARTLLGLVFTVGAAQLLLWGALDLADRIGLSQGLVGATLVAIGTSLPELVTVVQSARRNETDLIVGNLLGSNLFNALGVGAVVGLLDAPSLGATNLAGTGVIATIFVALVALVAMATNHTVTRREGAALVVVYLVLLPVLA